MSEVYTFVGGPLDGQQRAIKNDQNTWRCVERVSPLLPAPNVFPDPHEPVASPVHRHHFYVKSGRYFIHQEEK